jgi:hypothetical protein
MVFSFHGAGGEERARSPYERGRPCSSDTLGDVFGCGPKENECLFIELTLGLTQRAAPLRCPRARYTKQRAFEEV